MAAMPHVLKRVEHRPIEPGGALEFGELMIEPFAVEHGPTGKGALGFIVQYGRRKIILTCDFLRIPTAGDPSFRGADVCFMEANTWHPAPRTSHLSISEGLQLLAQWRPKRTYLIHYSGYEDFDYPGEPIHGPLDQASLRAAAAAASGGLAIDVACHGMILGDDVPWP